MQGGQGVGTNSPVEPGNMLWLSQQLGLCDCLFSRFETYVKLQFPVALGISTDTHCKG